MHSTLHPVNLKVSFLQNDLIKNGRRRLKIALMNLLESLETVKLVSMTKQVFLKLYIN